ncbi:MAG: hypothetical protein WBL19_01805 [Minisyncoccia bacterium]
MTEEEKLIKEQWDKLPPALQRAIESLPWKSLVKEVGQANALDNEQLVSLEREAMFILYGFENPADFVSNITREVGVSEEKALAVAAAIAEKIFEPISTKIAAGSGSNAALPMVEEGEKVHDAPHVEAAPTQPAPQARPEPKIKTPLPDYRYPDGTDPYREPLK